MMFIEEGICFRVAVVDGVSSEWVDINENTSVEISAQACLP